MTAQHNATQLVRKARSITFNQRVDVNSVNDKPRFKYNPAGTISPDCLKKGGCNPPNKALRNCFGENTFIYTIPIDVSLQQIYSQTFVLQTHGARGSGMNFTCYQKLIEGLPFAIVPYGRLPVHEKTYDGFGLPSIQKNSRRYRVTTPYSTFPTPNAVIGALIENSNDPVRLAKKRQQRHVKMTKRQRDHEKAMRAAKESGDKDSPNGEKSPKPQQPAIDSAEDSEGD